MLIMKILQGMLLSEDFLVVVFLNIFFEAFLSFFYLVYILNNILNSILLNFKCSYIIYCF